jgi:hypothetical protein
MRIFVAGVVVPGQRPALVWRVWRRFAGGC